MIVLYSGSGAQDFYTEGLEYSDEQWQKIHATVLKLLRAREESDAVEQLTRLPFRLYRGSNFFGDEFTVLQCSLPVQDYVELASLAPESNMKSTFRRIAGTFSEVGTYVRFIAAELDRSDAAEPVVEPFVETASETVRRALSDASHLLSTQGAVSALDRAHTAFHGFLRSVCAETAEAIPDDASLTLLFKILREKHPKFTMRGPRAPDIEKIYRALSAATDALNTLRNHASLAHPNDTLLKEPEAMLALNSIRTLFNYVLAKTNTA